MLPLAGCLALLQRGEFDAAMVEMQAANRLDASAPNVKASLPRFETLQRQLPAIQPVLDGRCSVGIVGSLPVIPDTLTNERLPGISFLMVAASPLTRSSYHAGEDFAKLKAARLALG